jgi:cytochrome c
MTKEGAPVEYPEFDLRFKTDSTPDGPPPGTPVVINAGMKGDRGFVIFSIPGEISAFIEAKC